MSPFRFVSNFAAQSLALRLGMLVTAMGVVSCLDLSVAHAQNPASNSPAAAPSPTASTTNPKPFVFGDSDAAREMWAAQTQYEAQRKSPALAFGWELLLPGAGNYYADEKEEAVLTWTFLLLGGYFLADGYGLVCEVFQTQSQCNEKIFFIVQGWIFVIGSRLFGLASAPANASRYNRALRARLGLDEPMSFGLVPWLARNDGGLQLALKF